MLRSRLSGLAEWAHAPTITARSRYSRQRTHSLSRADDRSWAGLTCGKIAHDHGQTPQPGPRISA